MIINAPPSAPDSTQLCPVVIPLTPNGIAIIGDVPYNDKVNLPFANAHFGTLAGLLRKAGVRIEDCIQANLLKVFPNHGVISLEQHAVVNDNIDEIVGVLDSLGTRTILFLGRQTLRWFKLAAGGVDDERGAPFLWQGRICLATYHPKELYLEYHNYPIVQADVEKLVRLSKEGWNETKLNITYSPTFPESVSFLDTLISRRPYLSTDWESVDSILGPYSLATCIGFGINGTRAFTIPFVREGGKHYFSKEEEVIIWRKVALALELCPQIGHNALQYDHWFAAHWCGILMNVVDDTMFAHWEVYTELPKSLAFLNSLYLDNPYWKDELKLARSGKVPRDREFLYNGRDNCITLQAAVEVSKEIKQLPPAVKEHYRFNVRCSRVFQYMALRGCVVNRDKLANRISSLEIEAQVATEKLADEAKRKINVRSPKQMKEWLYGDLMLPVKTKAVKLDDGSVEDRETSDFLTIAYLAREYPGYPALMTAALLRKALKRLSSLNAIKLGPNGECYWNFNLVGTETGRASGYKPYNGHGVQPQNVDNRDRDLFEAGHGQFWAKCDLEGADSWTVAGQLVKLGDPTMYNDLLAGVKPAQVLSLATILDESVISMPTAQLVELLKQHKPFLKTTEGKKIYATDKSVSHGTNYMMTAPTMHVTIFKRSLAELYVPVKECERKRLLYLKRYPGLNKLYEYIPTLINSTGFLDCPSGMHRVFFGRNDNHRTRVGLALIPQNNTAFATNRLLHNLYYRDYNRRGVGNALVVEPMNQVHDEADLAIREDELDKARDIFKKATDFTSEIWGLEFKIPFDPNYGPNWGECSNNLFD
jgi:hypothetical protein